MGPLDEYPFREMWEEFYRKEIRSTRLLTELYLYQACRQRKGDYRKNTELYKKVFGKGLLKKPPFTPVRSPGKDGHRLPVFPICATGRAGIVGAARCWKAGFCFK